VFGCGLSDVEINVQRRSNSRLCVIDWGGVRGLCDDGKYTVMITDCYIQRHMGY